MSTTARRRFDMTQLGRALLAGACVCAAVLLLELADLLRTLRSQPGGLDALGAPLGLRLLLGLLCAGLPVVLFEACLDLLVRGREDGGAWLPQRTLELAGALLFGVAPAAWLLRRLAAIPFFIAGEHVPALLGALLLCGVGSALPWLVCRLLPRVTQCPAGELPPRIWRSLAAGAGISLALFMVVVVQSGSLVRVPVGRSGVHLGFFLAAWASALGGSVGLSLRALLRIGGETRLPRLSGAAALLAGLLLSLADQRLFPGLYPAIHLWLKALAYLALDLSVWLLVASLTRPLASGRIRWALLLWLVGGLLGVNAWPGLDATERAALASGAWGRTLLTQLDAADREAPPPSFDLELEEALRAGRPVPVPTLAGARPHILLITIDTLRWDAVSAGVEDSLTPEINALAARSLRFERAYSQGARTSEAMTCLMTGHYGHHIPWQRVIYVEGGSLRSLADGPPKDGSVYSFSTVPAASAPPFLAERLKQASYQTTAIPFAGRDEFFRPDLGFARGFLHYEDLAGDDRAPPTSEWVADLAVLRLAQLSAGSAPFFLWVHLYDPHESAGDRRSYAQLVRSADRGVGRLLRGLRDLGIEGSTAVALVSDHGESFGEHGTSSHGSSLYDEQIRVPMLLHVPGLPPRSVAHPVATFDLAATLCRLGRAECGDMDAFDLLPVATASGDPEARPIFSELVRYLGQSGRPSHDRKAMIRGNYKIIHDRIVNVWQLYDVVNDPAESRDLSAARPLAFRDMRRLLRYWSQPHRSASPAPGRP